MTTAIRKWSQTATGNASVAGGANTINFSEGQAPSTVNNSAREMMAQIRQWYTASEAAWIEQSNTASVASQTAFKLSGDQTANWTANRRWRLRGGSTVRYGSVVSSSYTSETTITVTVDSGSLSASHSIAGLASITQDHIPANTYVTSASLATAIAGYITSASVATAIALKQNALQYQDEGVNLSAGGSAATVNFVGTGVSASLTTGVLTVTVTPPTQWTRIATLAPSGAATVEQTGLSGYQTLRITFNNIMPSVDNRKLVVRLSSDSSNYLTSTYAGGITDTDSTPGNVGLGEVTGFAIEDPASSGESNIGNAAGDGGMSGTMMIYNFNTAQKTIATFHGAFGNTNGALQSVMSTYWHTGQTAMQAIQFLMVSSGNLSGSIVIEGMP